MSSVILQNIQAQPDALRAVAEHQFGPGREALTRAAALLKESERIIFTGMGGSFCASLPAQYLFAELGISVCVLDTAELLYFASNLLTPKTAVVLVSRSGESVELTKLLPLLRQNNCRVISIVNVPDSTLANQADETIFINSPADQLIAIQTYTATVAVISLLAAAVAHQLDLAEHDLRLTSTSLERLLPTAFAADAHFSRRPVYLLGRGMSLATVNAGALLMHEMARLPAIGMACAQFRHGPVEVVTPDFQAVVVGTQAATADVDRKLAEDLASAGASVAWIGPANGRLRTLGTWPASVPPRFTPILEIVPIQILCFRLAEMGNIPVGTFRFAAPVTLSETDFRPQETTPHA
ncbi:MAG: SIS domain-containing protein [Acidobacteriaceae bacterium]|nr:SIS domain-containing protein [Acidobacteriaceae bacterium]